MKAGHKQTNPKPQTMKNEVHDRLQTYGPAALTDKELMTILAPKGADKICQNASAERSHLHFWEAIQQADTATLKKWGATTQEAARITAAMNLAPRITAARVHNIRSSKDAADALSPYLNGLTNEQFYMILLNKANNIINITNVSTGAVSSCVVPIDKIVRQAVLTERCSAVIVAHNHPSGTLRPSEQDIRLTSQIKNALKFVNIDLLDHIIYTDNGYRSFADEGEL